MTLGYRVDLTFCYNENMIIGLGNDMESITRVAAVVERTPRFVATILTVAEQAAAKQRQGKHYAEYLAGRFSAKEAFAKATGQGIGFDYHWQDIEILNDSTGRPMMSVRGCDDRIHVAITHSGDYVSTVVIIEK